MSSVKCFQDIPSFKNYRMLPMFVIALLPKSVSRVVWIGIAILQTQKMPIMLSDTLLETTRTEIDWCAADNA